MENDSVNVSFADYLKKRSAKHGVKNLFGNLKASEINIFIWKLIFLCAAISLQVNSRVKEKIFQQFRR
jgi:hypothetical protein